MLKQATVFTSGIGVSKCTNNVNMNPSYCYVAPPYCISKSGGSCTSPVLLNLAIQQSPIQFYNCHGFGYKCAWEMGGNVIVTSSSVPTFEYNPIIFTVSCWGAVIPGASDYQAVKTSYDFSSPPLAVAMFSQGASVYIGPTIIGLGSSSLLVSSYTTVATW